MNWRDLPIVIVDTETTGLDPAVARIVEIAAVVVRDGQLTGRFSQLVFHDDSMPPAATACNGITDEMLKGAPVFADVAFDLVAVVESQPCVVAGYNCPFDRAMLIAEFHRAVITPPAFCCGGDESPWLDVGVWARWHDPFASGKGRHKLGAVAARLGVEVSQAHRALGDCETTARVLAKLRDEPMHPDSLCKRIPDAMSDVVLQQQRLRAISSAEHFYYVATKRREERLAANG